MQVVETKLSELVHYINNPRKNDHAVDKVAAAIREFGFRVPILCKKDGTIIDGHLRAKAAKKLGLDAVPVVYIDDMTDAQIKAFRISINRMAELAEWDDELLGVELQELREQDFDLELTGFDFGDIDKLIDDDGSNNSADAAVSLLRDTFIEPPFSVLDTKTGSWQDRKRKWVDLGIESDLGRDVELFNLACDVAPSAKKVSVFDPALCEVLYSWFCPEGGLILDPFAGGSVRGIVANFMGYNYTGIDIRKEQIDSNIDQAAKIIKNNIPKWIVGDSNLVLDGLGGEFDFVFSCPPYGDLEVYSDIDGDISNKAYSDFIDAYSEIIKKSCRLLKNGAYACFVVSEFRDKKGNYRGFVPDTISAFEKIGMRFYNEIILLNCIVSAAFRARNSMKNKKVVRIHQNILVFKKE